MRMVIVKANGREDVSMATEAAVRKIDGRWWVEWRAELAGSGGFDLDRTNTVEVRFEPAKDGTDG